MNKIVTTLIFLSISITLKAQSIKDGNWKGIVHYETVNVPFTFSLKFSSDTSATVILKNAKEEIIISDVVLKEDSIYIPMYVFDAVIKAKYSEGKMIGEWHKNYRSKKGPLFTAEFNEPRFTLKTYKSDLIYPNWNITFTQPSGQTSKAQGLFKQIGENGIEATIMTEVGDFRYFEGIIFGDSIKMSSFDGVHGFLMLGAFKKGEWSGEFHYEYNYSEKWVSTEITNKSDQVLTNPFSVITVEPQTHIPYWDILTAGGEYNTIDTDVLEGKVVIVQLMGTWCPNSLDQTKYLTEWYSSQNKEKISLMAVTYESGDKKYSQKRIESYSEKLNIPYPMYIGGSLSKGQAALAFPNMGKINAFPTLIMIDKKGYIRYIDSYFNGPATGRYYEEFKVEFNDRVKELLNE